MKPSTEPYALDRSKLLDGSLYGLSGPEVTGTFHKAGLLHALQIVYLEYEHHLDRDIYRPNSRTIHTHYRISPDPKWNYTEFSLTGLLIKHARALTPEETATPEMYIKEAVKPLLSHRLHCLLLAQNGFWDIASELCGIEVPLEKMPDLTNAVYTDWFTFDRYMLKISKAYDLVKEATTFWKE